MGVQSHRIHEHKLGIKLTLQGNVFIRCHWRVVKWRGRRWWWHLHDRWNLGIAVFKPDFCELFFGTMKVITFQSVFNAIGALRQCLQTFNLAPLTIVAPQFGVAVSLSPQLGSRHVPYR